GTVDFPFSANLNDVISDSYALIVVTAHQEYKNLDLTRIKSLMKKNPIIIDGRETFSPEKVIQLGFIYRAIGRGQYNF
ncbi:MAG: UDP binding domain-containing protein, partial [Candidatus Hodarchaeota archaeon]